VPFFGAFRAAWDDAMVARWSANPLGMLRPEIGCRVRDVRRQGRVNHSAAASGHHHRYWLAHSL
jgi:hypothetical protein